MHSQYVDASLPLDIMFPPPPDTDDLLTTPYVSNLRQTMREAHEFAREHLKISTNRQKHDYDHKAQIRTFKTGDLV